MWQRSWSTRWESGARIGEPFCVAVGPPETFIEEFPAQNIKTTRGITIINMQWEKRTALLKSKTLFRFYKTLYLTGQRVPADAAGHGRTKTHVYVPG